MCLGWLTSEAVVFDPPPLKHLEGSTISSRHPSCHVNQPKIHQTRSRNFQKPIFKQASPWQPTHNLPNIVSVACLVDCWWVTTVMGKPTGDHTSSQCISFLEGWQLGCTASLVASMHEARQYSNQWLLQRYHLQSYQLSSNHHSNAVLCIQGNFNELPWGQSVCYGYSCLRVALH